MELQWTRSGQSRRAHFSTNFIIVNNLQEKSITESRHRWNFHDHFTLPLLGYGHITPETPLGQIDTVLYTFLSVPLTMLTLKTIGKMVSKLVYDFVYAIETMLLSRKRPRNVKKKNFFVTFTLMILTVCLGGLEGVYVEGWTFVQAFTHGSLHFPLWATVTTFPDGVCFYKLTNLQIRNLS